MMIELKGCGFALRARVLSFIADNRDTQESIKWRLGSPANSDRILGRVAAAQINAIGKWGAPHAGAFDYLREITHPMLMINGSNDVFGCRGTVSNSEGYRSWLTSR
jgi:hypothetical protein